MCFKSGTKELRVYDTRSGQDSGATFSRGYVSTYYFNNDDKHNSTTRQDGDMTDQDFQILECETVWTSIDLRHWQSVNFLTDQKIAFQFYS